MATSGPEPLVIAAGYSPEVQFFDAVDGGLRRSTLVLKDYGHVNRLAVSPNEPRLLAVAGNPHVRLFEAFDSARSEPISSFEGHKNNVLAVGFEATSRWLYTGSEDGTIRVWDCRSLKSQLCHENFGVHDRAAVHSVDIHPNQVELVIGDGEGQVILWDLRANKIRHTYVPEEGVPVRAVCFAPDAKMAVCANHEGTCYVWKVSESELFLPLQKIDAHTGYVLSCRFSPEAKHLATTSSDGTTNIWRSHAEGFARCLTLTGHTKWVWDCDFSRDGQYIVTASSDATCRLWDVRTGTQLQEFADFKKGVTSVVLVDSVVERAR